MLYELRELTCYTNGVYCFSNFYPETSVKVSGSLKYALPSEFKLIQISKFSSYFFPDVNIQRESGLTKGNFGSCHLVSVF